MAMMAIKSQWMNRLPQKLFDIPIARYWYGLPNHNAQP
jgi:hypothetical protein